MFSEADLDTMQLLRCAFDPGEHLQPGKGVSRRRGCAAKCPDRIASILRRRRARRADVDARILMAHGFSPVRARRGRGRDSARRPDRTAASRPASAPGRRRSAPTHRRASLSSGEPLHDDRAAPAERQRIAQAVDHALLQLHLAGNAKQKHAGARASGRDVAPLSGKPFDQRPASPRGLSAARSPSTARRDRRSASLACSFQNRSSSEPDTVCVEVRSRRSASPPSRTAAPQTPRSIRTGQSGAADASQTRARSASGGSPSILAGERFRDRTARAARPPASATPPSADTA